MVGYIYIKPNKLPFKIYFNAKIFESIILMLFKQNCFKSEAFAILIINITFVYCDLNSRQKNIFHLAYITKSVSRSLCFVSETYKFVLNK